MTTSITSIMFVTYNRIELTKRMLNSFFEHTTSPYHLIVVDNGSTDGTPEFLQSLNKSNDCPTACQGVDIHFNEKNKGIAAGRNKGLKLSAKYKDPYLSTLDNDIELLPNWLEDCLDIIKANPNYYIGINMEDVKYPLKTVNCKTFQYKDKGNLGTACMVFDRELHNKIGYFYGFTDLYGEEDSDWGMRSRLAGYQMGYLKENGVHFGTGDLDTGEYREWKTACHTKNLAPFQQRCYDYMNRKVPIFVPYSE